MGKWQHENDEIQINENVAVGYAASTDEASEIVRAHNNDIDVLENGLKDVRMHSPIERDYNPGPDWASKVLVVWAEDDAPVPDKERASSALARLMGCSDAGLPNPKAIIDHGDSFDYLFQGGWVMSIYPDGGDIGFVYKEKKR